MISTKKLLHSLLFPALFTALVVSEAHAEVIVNAEAATNYNFRGISQTQNGPGISAGITYNHKSNFYIGAWYDSVSKVMYTKGYGMETDFVGGYKKEFKHVNVDAGVLGMLYPGAKVPDSNTKYDTYEFYASVESGPLKLQINQSLGRYFAIAKTRGTRYYQSELTLPIRPWVKLHGNLNYLDSPLGRDDSFYDGRVGFIFPVLGGDLSAHYCKNILKTKAREDNTIKDEKLYKNTFVVTYGYTHSF